MKHALTDTAVKNAKPKGKAYKLADGGGFSDKLLRAAAINCKTIVR